MDPLVHEWLNLMIRWAHVMFGIAWIGSSFYFMWLDAHGVGDQVKLSAAWLIEKAGLNKGFSLPGSKAAISTKHALAITNRGGATAQEVVELARFIQETVANRFGVTLVPEPNLVGF